MRRAVRLALACAAAAALGTAAAAQEPPEIPNVISPLRVETDHNGVNLVTGKTQMPTPVLSAPGAPNLRFDRVQNAAPYVRGTINAGSGGEAASTASFSVHTGSGTEAFRCHDFDCTSVTGTGSGFVQNSRAYRQAGTGAQWTFNILHSDTGGSSNPRQVLYYASQVAYPSSGTAERTDRVRPQGGNYRFVHNINPTFMDHAANPSCCPDPIPLNWS